MRFAFAALLVAACSGPMEPDASRDGARPDRVALTLDTPDTVPCCEGLDTGADAPPEATDAAARDAPAADAADVSVDVARADAPDDTPPPPPDVVCSAPQTNCRGACVSTASDPMHCGGCGRACARFGMCVMGSCYCGLGPGGAECPYSGGMTCTNLSNDPMNCGDCGHVCSAASPRCLSGSCTP